MKVAGLSTATGQPLLRSEVLGSDVPMWLRDEMPPPGAGNTELMRVTAYTGYQQFIGIIIGVPGYIQLITSFYNQQ